MASKAIYPVGGVSSTKPANRRPNVRSHRCQELGHYANECPKFRSQLYIAEEDEEIIPTAENWEDLNREERTYYFSPDEVQGESLVSQRLCLAPKTSEDWRRRDIFTTNCTISDKICKVIIDTGS
jgi:Zinc knuckle